MRRVLFGVVGLVFIGGALVPPSSLAGHERPLFHRPHSLTYVAGKLIFVARDGVHGIELWKTTGTRAGTRIVEPIRSGLENYGEEQPEEISWLTRWKGYVYYSRNSTVDEGVKLWRSDGTKAGTHMVKDSPEGVTWRPRYLTVFEDALYFIATSPSGSGYDDELWKTDGTEEGTVMVADPDGSWIHHLAKVGETLFLTTEDESGAEAIWSSDGTASGTVHVRTVIPGTPATPSCALIGSLYEAGGLAYFPVAEGHPSGECNEDLWRSDGTSAGTFKLRELDLPQWGSHRVSELDGHAVFVGNDPEHSLELWKSDGTPEGTVMIEDVNPGAQPSQVTAVAHDHYSPDPSFGDHHYFDADDGEHGREVWVSDGTAEGTELLADVRRGPKGSHPHNFQAVESRGLVFFLADDGRHGFELWKTDGTAAGTRMVSDVNPRGDGIANDYLGPGLTRLRNHLYFFATDGEHPLELWRTDGTRRGTKRVGHL